MTKRYSDAGTGLVCILVVQMLVIPTQITLDTHQVNMPASILVMLLIAATMILGSSVSSQVAPFYHKYLRRPTDFLGRHMSLGFVSYFILLIQDHVSSANELSRIVGVFVVTTLVSYTASFSIAFAGSRLERRLRCRRNPSADLESNNKVQPSPSIAWPAPPFERQPKRISQLSSLSEDSFIKESLAHIEAFSDTKTASTIDFFLRSAPIWICLTLLVMVGLPVYLATGYVTPFELFIFALFWTASIHFQRSLRSSCLLLRFEHLRSCLLIFANPILATWALGTGYMFAKRYYTGKSLDVLITEFRHYSSLSESIIHIMQGGSNNFISHLGAGDLASLVLDAGVACMGLKIYEYRFELWASLGTVSVTCTALAAINVFLNILIGYWFGLRAEDAIAFASRSATLALGVPAIENLHGSTTLTSALAIFSGVLFQMVGDWILTLLQINDRGDNSQLSHQQLKPRSNTTSVISTPPSIGNTTEERRSTIQGPGDGSEIDEDKIVIAAGITVGINAAAIGTAYLIERDSRATAYSALSMIVFGAATVALTALPGVLDFTTSLWAR